MILLLISSDFIRSRYCQKVELAEAIKRHETGSARVVPIILRSCRWQIVPFGEELLGKLQALPQPLKPVKSWTDQDEAFTSIVEGLEGIIEELRRQTPKPEPKAQKLAESVSVAEAAEQQPPTATEPEPIIEPLPVRPAPQPRRAEPEDDLRSEKGIDYRKLWDLLKAGLWKEADQETADQMLKAMDKKSWGDVYSDDLLSFPCANLLTIDGLWVKYSQGRFGFSVQKEIYVRCGAKLDGKYPANEIWEKFCDTVGWCLGGSYIPYSAVTSNTSAPQGHLPGVRLCVDASSRFSPSLTSRLAECKR
ncbi:hypothetical protein C7271_13130 [filamentous cyanobacterium CCP5]|nr:hypothetical protein C7271_13130 [filamentous cyanobacterium CCP5]